MKFTLIVQPDTTPSGIEGYSAHCPELDIASQGETAGEAKANLQEALEMFFEDADVDEIERRLHRGVEVSALEFAV